MRLNRAVMAKGNLLCVLEATLASRVKEAHQVSAAHIAHFIDAIISTKSNKKSVKALVNSSQMLVIEAADEIRYSVSGKVALA